MESSLVWWLCEMLHVGLRVNCVKDALSFDCIPVSQQLSLDIISHLSPPCFPGGLVSFEVTRLCPGLHYRDHW